MKAFLANFPLPESILTAVVLGLILRWLVPVPVLPAVAILTWVGVATVLLGGGIILWATVTAREIQIADPDRLLTSGPYALSRNPMYVGWMAAALGLSLALHSLWLLVLTLAAGLYLHVVTIPREEKALASAFGDAYRRYRAQVPRYC